MIYYLLGKMETIKGRKNMYYTYMLRCSDNSLYTGIITDLERRLQEHKAKEEKGAKYTHTHTAVKVEAAWQSENRKLASQLEYRMKTLAKMQKEQVIQNNSFFSKFFDKTLEAEKYKRVK